MYSVLNLGTEMHRRKYYDDIASFRLPGCFAMTELKHGGRVAWADRGAACGRVAWMEIGAACGRCWLRVYRLWVPYVEELMYKHWQRQ